MVPSKANSIEENGDTFLSLRCGFAYKLKASTMHRRYAKWYTFVLCDSADEKEEVVRPRRQGEGVVVLLILTNAVTACWTHFSARPVHK